jgi:hypothetical protein
MAPHASLLFEVLDVPGETVSLTAKPCIYSPINTAHASSIR